MSKDDLFICYSNNVKDKLVENNVKYVVHGHNKDKNKDFWVFIKDFRCREILNKWRDGVYKK